MIPNVKIYPLVYEKLDRTEIRLRRDSSRKYYDVSGNVYTKHHVTTYFNFIRHDFVRQVVVINPNGFKIRTKILVPQEAFVYNQEL